MIQLAINFMDIIYVPLAYILKFLFWIIGDYGWAILAFSLLTKLLMLPMGIKGEKSRLRMNAIQPKMRKLQEKYQNDTRNPKYQQEMQDLYAQEGYNPMSGCLPQLIQFPLIFGLWNAIRRPLSYVCDFSEAKIVEIVNKLLSSGLESPILNRLHTLFDGNDVLKTLKYNEIYIAQAINENTDKVDGLQQLVDGHMMINTKFLGIDLGATASELKGWFLLIPVLAALTSFLVSFISMRINRASTENSDPTAKSMNAVMYTMPLLSLWIGYTMNFGVALYWISSNLLSLVQTVLLAKFVRPKVEAEAAAAAAAAKAKKKKRPKTDPENRTEALPEDTKKKKKK